MKKQKELKSTESDLVRHVCRQARGLDRLWLSLTSMVMATKISWSRHQTLTGTKPTETGLSMTLEQYTYFMGLETNRYFIIKINMHAYYVLVLLMVLKKCNLIMNLVLLLIDTNYINECILKQSQTNSTCSVFF